MSNFNPSTVAMLSALPPLFLLSAFFSGSETVLFSLTGGARARIRARNPAADELIGACLADKALLFSTLLVGNTFVNFALSTIGYHLLSAFIPGGGWLTVPVMTMALLFLGEITPKRLALKYAEGAAPVCARLLLFWRAVLSPFNFALRFTTKAFAPALERERRALSDDEFVTVMEAAAENGAVTASDAEMVEGVLRLSELCANDEMTPRVDIEGYDRDRPEDYRKQIIACARHRYLPVYSRNPDGIEGVIDVETLKIEDALFVPETVTLDDLLVIFAKSGKPLAVVLDEYGGTAGIISPNDILELVVGPRVFADPRTEPALREHGANCWDIDARASLDEINFELETDLQAEDADRLSGWVQFHAGSVPHVGQQIEADGCRATVLKRRRHRVTEVRLEILHRHEAGTEEEIIAETDEAAQRTEKD